MAFLTEATERHRERSLPLSSSVAYESPAHQRLSRLERQPAPTQRLRWLSRGCTVAIQFDMNVIVVILPIPSKHDAPLGFAEPLPVPEDHSLDLINLAIVHTPVEKPVAPSLAVRIGVIKEDVGGPPFIMHVRVPPARPGVDAGAGTGE